jgi:hypothetical protein
MESIPERKEEYNENVNLISDSLLEDDLELSGDIEELPV